MREEQILSLIRRGMTDYSDIANTLDMPRNQVSVHLNNLLGKGLVVRAGRGIWKEPVKPAKVLLNEPEDTSAFIRPIPKSKLMGGRA